MYLCLRFDVDTAQPNHMRFRRDSLFSVSTRNALDSAKLTSARAGDLVRRATAVSTIGIAGILRIGVQSQQNPSRGVSVGIV